MRSQLLGEVALKFAHVVFLCEQGLPCQLHDLLRPRIDAVAGLFGLQRLIRQLSSWAARIVPSRACAARAGGEAKRSLWDLLYQDCVKSPYVWLFAIAYFFVYVVRQGVTSWFIFYLQARSLSHAQAATCSIFLVQFAGESGVVDHGTQLLKLHHSSSTYAKKF